MITLRDITIGRFPITQKFGQNPENYKKFGIIAHNGIDIATPTDTIILNPFPTGNDVEVSFIGFNPSNAKGYDPEGYGNFIRIWDKTQQFVILYAHCRLFDVVLGDKLHLQQAVGRTNNTGNSMAEHVHVGGYFVDVMGNKLNRDNGYDGCVDLLNPEIVKWNIDNPTAPATLPVSIPTVTIPAETHTQLVTNSDNFQRVIDILKPGNQVDATTSKEIIDVISDYQDRLKTLSAVEKERDDLLTYNEAQKAEIANLRDQVKDVAAAVAVTVTPLPVEATPSPTGETTDTIGIIERFFTYLFSLK